MVIPWRNGVQKRIVMHTVSKESIRTCYVRGTWYVHVGPYARAGGTLRLRMLNFNQLALRRGRISSTPGPALPENIDFSRSP
jgi:hypothetical protein